MAVAFCVLTPTLAGCALVMLLLGEPLAATALTVLAAVTAKRR